MLTSFLAGAVQVYLAMTITVASVQGVTTYFQDRMSYTIDGNVVQMTEDEYSDAVIDGTIRPKLRPDDL